MMRRETLSAVSLFTGAGGLDIGIERAGFKTAVAVEIDRYACETLRANQLLGRWAPRQFEHWFAKGGDYHFRRKPPHIRDLEFERVVQGVGRHDLLADTQVIEGDIRKVSSEEILDAAKLSGISSIDLVFGGPPCQPFSRAGKRQTVEEERGQLFMEFVRIVRDLRPRWFLFENVKGLGQSKTTVWAMECPHCRRSELPEFDGDRVEPENGSLTGSSCSNCGSPLRWKVTRNKPGGSLEIVVNEFARLGYACSCQLLRAVEFGVPQKRERFFIVGSRDHERFAFPEPTHFPASSLLSDNRYATVWDTIFFKRNPAHEWPLDPSQAVLWVKNVVRPHDEPVTWSLLEPSPTIGAHQSAKLAIAPRGVPEEQLARQQWHVLGRRQGDTKPVHVDHSYLSDHDILRLQTFPEWWYLSGTRMERAFQVGNAVPPMLAEAVARQLTGVSLRESEPEARSA